MHQGLLRLIVIASGLFLSAIASAAALVDPLLQQRLTSGAGPHQVVITFKQPIAGALLTTAQVQIVRQLPAVESIYFNARLSYSNYTSGEITGGHYVHDA
ncbi:MAG: hypothetical protein ACREUC_10905, partial [Steroidobacteraceae bacterium]